MGKKSQDAREHTYKIVTRRNKYGRRIYNHEYN